jgi:hypothetical protein
MGIETLPVQSALFLSDFGHKTTRINRPVLVSEHDGDEFENIFPDF